jgi:hypothetical protein
MMENVKRWEKGARDEEVGGLGFACAFFRVFLVFSPVSLQETLR